MQRVFQDWHAWLEEGILDLAVPMNYARESDDRVRTWFDGWVAWERRHQHRRGTVVGLGGYRNSPDATLAQIGRVRRVEGLDRLAGISLFSYRVPVAGPDGSESAPLAFAGERLLFLSAGTPDSPGAFASAAPLPRLPWVAAPGHGFLAGTVSAASRADADDVEVEIRRTGLFRTTRRVRTDATGFFGVARLAPGRYRVRLAGTRAAETETHVDVTAGNVGAPRSPVPPDEAGGKPGRALEARPGSRPDQGLASARATAAPRTVRPPDSIVLGVTKYTVSSGEW
ncbi:MAG: hypothetical protein IPN03_01705 [Holophagales bacterium]|nr:hypothetical protein [Holophagales bacterium]